MIYLYYINFNIQAAHMIFILLTNYLFENMIYLHRMVLNVFSNKKKIS